jgi:hypothetical protein
MIKALSLDIPHIMSQTLTNATPDRDIQNWNDSVEMTFT